MSRLPFSLAAVQQLPQSVSEATADLIIVGGVVSAFAMGSLRVKCAVVQAAVDSGKRVGDLTVDELVAIIQRENAR